MMRVAIYARYSTDRQRPTSIDDQVRICRAHAEREGWTVAGVFSDCAQSGSLPIASRAGSARLLAAALEDQFDVLLLEGLDRLSRDAVEQEITVRRLEHRGIRILGLSDGYDSESGARRLTRGVRGLINEVYLEDLRAKTHRGLAGRAARGLHTGGRPYGYRSVTKGDGHVLEIDEDEARWVRWIFERYADGWFGRRIAGELNRLRVPSPRGGTWALSAIYADRKKGCGILANELYIGQVIWNRSRWIKDPDIGKRKRIERPRSEWLVQDVPELRIVSDELWRAARDRDAVAASKPSRGRGAPARTLFGGLLTCGRCGAPMTAVDALRYGCSHARDRGEAVCSGVHVKRTATDEALVDLVREELLGEDAMRDIQAFVREALRDARKDSQGRNQAAHRRLSELGREIGNLTDALAACGTSDALTERLVAAEREKRALEAELRNAGDVEDVPQMIPRLFDRYRELVTDLPAILRRDPMKIRGMLAGLLGTIRIVPEQDGIYAEVGCYEQIIKMAENSATLKVVAGAGFEPATFGL